MKLNLPKLSATMEEGTILNWVKRPGDHIQEGDILYEIETDKATMEVESSVTGTLEKILVEAGIAISAGTEICEITLDGAGITKDGEVTVKNSANPLKAAEPSVAIEPDSKDDKGSTWVQEGSQTESELVEQRIEKTTNEGIRLLASPSARRLARKLGVNVNHVQGTGPSGRVRNRDIEAAASVKGEAATSHHSTKQINLEQATSAVKPIDKSSLSMKRAETTVTQEVSKMRLTIAKELVRSTQTIPTFWVEKWVNAGELLKWKDLLKQSRGETFNRLTITDFVLQAIGLTLLEFPSVNRRWIVNAVGQISIEQVSGSHVGLAISVENGVIAPILANVGECSLVEVAKLRGDAVEAVRSSRLYGLNEPVAITLSNLGNTGIDRFRAIIKPDETMILALGGMQERVAAVEGQIVVQKGFNMVLSADHRVIDGEAAAHFLGKIASLIETGTWKIA